jgi:hypothetical protein
MDYREGTVSSELCSCCNGCKPPTSLIDCATATVQETLFILEKASFFGTQAGDVYQVSI